MSMASAPLSFLSGLSTVLIVMAIISLIELMIPLHAHHRVGRRYWVNFSLMGITLSLGFLFNVSLVVLLAFFQSQNWSLVSLPGLWFDVLIVVVVLDFATWVAHWAMHKAPFLWRLHLVHHADGLVDVTTSFRQHPLEGVWRFIVVAAFALALGAPPETVALYRALSAINALLEHGNFRVFAPVDRWVGKVWVTPNFHKLHHSSLQSETDSNYGNLFTLFDRLFGTLSSPTRAANVEYGLHEFARPEEMRLRDVLRLPFAHKKSRP